MSCYKKIPRLSYKNRKGVSLFIEIKSIILYEYVKRIK